MNRQLVMVKNLYGYFDFVYDVSKTVGLTISSDVEVLAFLQQEFEDITEISIEGYEVFIVAAPKDCVNCGEP